MGAFLGQAALQKPHPIREPGLTPAEAILLDIVAEGLDNRAIALRLGKCEKTVRNQLSIIFQQAWRPQRRQAIAKSFYP
ncbi:hypothetical protein [Aliihoeflea sp. 40Bstr573]|uniref:hypothetical protein n=1 Tax=Aliihoeflea sp. 40Bstr573 TaxID=2696467 RepID=UPI0020947C01|nr:hypothetical protein [Aliihoeflea sp. 40Bstr573]MCO6388771.1 hypothetical protein [Aliihoeflea sp. 40Bstr573]